MAIAGLMKVQQSSVARRNPYGLMILLAFGAAFLGVLALHMARERRVFDLLVKEKETELTSLYLLLQKERENGREAKWKLEEMRTKVGSFRAQKRSLDSKIMEMQSTISSLREEQRLIQLALDEKLDQIKLMKEASNHIPSSQTEFQVNLPAKVLSVSTDDSSSANVDLQTAAVGEGEINTGLQEPNKSEAEKDSMGVEQEDSGSLHQKNFQMQDAASRNKEGLVFTDDIHDQYTKNDVQKTVEEGLPNAEGVENKESRMSYKGGQKLEMTNHRQIGRNSDSYLRKSKRKRLTKIHKSRKNRENSIRNGVAATSEGTISEDHKSKTVDLPQSNSPEQEIREQRVVDVKAKKDLDMNNEDQLKEESKDISQLLGHGESKGKPTRAGMSVEKSEIVNDASNSSEVQNSHEVIPRNTTSNALGEMLSKINQQNESQATSVQQPRERLDTHHKDEVSEQADPVSHGEE